MLYYSTIVIQSKDVHADVVLILRPVLSAVQGDVIVLCDEPLELHTFAGIVSSHLFKILNEGFFAFLVRSGVMNKSVADVPLHRFRPGRSATASFGATSCFDRSELQSRAA